MHTPVCETVGIEYPIIPAHASEPLARHRELT
jgi:hypothetical protein